MKVITNTAISIDGRISTVNNVHVAIGSPEDLRYMSVLRNQSDAVLVGGNTFRNWPIPLVADPKALATQTQKTQPIWNIVVSRKMDFTFPDKTLSSQAVRYLFLTDQKNISNFPFATKVCPTAITALWMYEQIAALGVETLLIEGGGDLLFQWLAADLIDEMYITLCPKLIGGKGAPSLLDGVGLASPGFRELTLLDHRLVGEEFFLHYAVKKS